MYWVFGIRGHEVGLQQQDRRAKPGDALPTGVPGGQDVSDGGLLRGHPSLETLVALVDISRAYFNAYIGHEVFAELPAEAGRSKGTVGQLIKRMYGTHDAAQGWEGVYREALEPMG